MKNDRVIIDVNEGKIKVRAQDDEVTFNVFEGLKHSNTGKDCLRKNIAKEAFPETKEQLDLSNILEMLYIIVLHKQLKRKISLYPNLWKSNSLLMSYLHHV